MAKPLILKSLEIQGFRAFKNLRIDRLGRVNLVTGKNNVGKSYLLEALWVYAHHGSPAQIFQLMQQRDEMPTSSSFSFTPVESDLEQQILNIKHLFHGRKDIEAYTPWINIGPIDDRSAALRISIEWVDQSLYGMADRVLALVVEQGTQEPKHYPLAQYVERWPSLPKDRKKPIPSTFVWADGFAPQQVASLWDTIALTDLEREVLAALRLIAPDVQRVTFVGEQDTSWGRTPIVKTPQLDAPVPLRSMGEGMNRLLGIALALVSARDGILLVDEIESGLHYSVQPDLWRLIFKVAHRLNVQVFATTHSWDNIAAFQRAAQEDDHSEGMLISLRHKQNEPEQVVAILFDEEELKTVTRENIEVR